MPYMVSSATVASNRGPNAPGDVPNGNSARVLRPHLPQRPENIWNSVTIGRASISVTWWRCGSPTTSSGESAGL